MTVLNLNNYQSVQTAMFVRLDVPDYDVLLFSDFNRPYTIGSDTYQPLGKLLSVSQTNSELRAVPGELSLSLSGIPNASIAEFLDNPIRGSSIQVWRVLFSTATGAALGITGNPAGRFQGIVNNFGIEEDYDFAGQSASSTITLTCSSVQELLNNKVSGRRTNPTDQKLLYPTDVSMDRVLKLSKSNLNWGAPQ